MTEVLDDDMGNTPRFRRARGYFLYDSNGRRYLDLDLCGSRAILGHKPAGLGRDLKAVVDRGLLDTQSRVEHERLFRQLEEMFPGMRAAGYLDLEAAHLHRVTRAGVEIALWRYGASAAGTAEAAAAAGTAEAPRSPVPPLQVVVLPVPDSSIALPLLVRRDQGAHTAAPQALAAAGHLHDRVPGLATAALLSVIHAMRRDSATSEQGGAGQKRPVLTAAQVEVPDSQLQELQELTSAGCVGDLSCEVSGRYVQWKGDPATIKRLQRSMADAGFHPPRSLQTDAGDALLYPVYLPLGITLKEYRRLGACVTLN